MRLTPSLPSPLPSRARPRRPSNRRFRRRRTSSLGRVPGSAVMSEKSYLIVKPLLRILFWREDIKLLSEEAKYIRVLHARRAGIIQLIFHPGAL